MITTGRPSANDGTHKTSDAFIRSTTSGGEIPPVSVTSSRIPSSIGHRTEGGFEVTRSDEFEMDVEPTVAKDGESLEQDAMSLLRRHPGNHEDSKRTTLRSLEPRRLRPQVDTATDGVHLGPCCRGVCQSNWALV